MVIEEGVAGSKPITDRPVAGELISRLNVGDIVIASKLSRLFRSAVDALITVEKLKKLGVKLHLIDLGGDISGNGLTAYDAEQESQSIPPIATALRR